MRAVSNGSTYTVEDVGKQVALKNLTNPSNHPTVLAGDGNVYPIMNIDSTSTSYGEQLVNGTIQGSEGAFARYDGELPQVFVGWEDKDQSSVQGAFFYSHGVSPLVWVR